MKRLGVFQLYDPDGYVDEFKYVLLESMKEVLGKLIIVINGKIEEEALLRLKGYTDSIHIRKEDRGFDAGAFRDVFLKFYERNFFEQWDEVVLFNDTFYGPLCSWNVVFDRMENEKVDFWGMEKFVLKECNLEQLYDSNWYPEYIQSYFIAFRKKMLISDAFLRFWMEVGYPVNKRVGVKVYEERLTGYFSKAGFNYTTWLEVMGLNYDNYQGKMTMQHFAYEALRDYEFPIVKAKTFSVFNSIMADKVIDYIKNEKKYDVRLIERHIKRLLSLGKGIGPYSPITLQKFVETHNAIYIFGHGYYGKGMEEYFHKQNWRFQAFIVSKATQDNEISLNEICIDDADGVIVALGLCALIEMEDRLKKIFKKNQIIFPQL